MTPQQFDKLAADPNPEALCHAVHIETGDAIVDYYVDLRSNPRRIATTSRFSSDSFATVASMLSSQVPTVGLSDIPPMRFEQLASINMPP